MKLKIITALIVAPLCLAATFLAAHSAPVQVTTTEVAQDDSWLREPFYKQFPDQRDAVDKELQILRVNLDEDAAPEYFAWLSLSRINGLGILFDRQDNTYQSVYQLEVPVYQVSFDQPTRSLIISAGNGGTGIQHNWFHVIQNVSGNYREVWAGIEQSSMFSVLPFSQRYGTVSLSQDPVLNAPVLRHTTRTSVLNEDYTVRETRDAVDTYVFKPDQGRFVPVGQISGVSKHLILDRPEAFAGEGVKVLLIGVTSNQMKGLEVNMINSVGQVVASTSNLDPKNIWLSFPKELAPGTYSVELIQQGGNQQTVLARTSIAIRNPQG